MAGAWEAVEVGASGSAAGGAGAEPERRRPPQLPALTAVRFFAALHVALYHMVRPFTLWGPLTGLMAAGYTGVSFFFLLSGYILTYSHAAESMAAGSVAAGSVVAGSGAARGMAPAVRRRFYFARFARIYPAYLVALLWAGVLLRYQVAERVHVLAFGADVVLLQTWSLRMVSFFNVPAWSVSAEAFFYLVFPFVVLRLRPTGRRGAVLGVGALWLLAMVMPVVCLIYAPQGAWHEGAGMFAFWVRRFPPFALPEFLAGIPLAWLFVRYRPGVRVAEWMGWAGVVGVVAVLLVADHLPAILLHNGLLLPLYALVLLGLSEETWLAGMLAWRPLVVLGEASYALYLTHFLLNDWMETRWHVGSGLASLAWKLPIAIGLALGVYAGVERPCRRWLLRWRSGVERASR